MGNKRPLSSPLYDQSKKPRLQQDPDLSIRGSTSVSLPLLNLGLKVFLSHSGEDKGFVQILYERLCRHYHNHAVAFFDEKSLPKAEKVSMENILEEARRSELGVLVLTEHFFTYTLNPMRELEAFVASGVKLLPLFFGMSVDEFKKKDRRNGWEKRWRDWFCLDEKVIKKWREALDHVSTFCGLEYCKIATNDSDYVDAIVKEVTRIVGPAISFSKGGVFGIDRLCKEVNRMYEKCASKRSSSVDHMQSTQVASTSASSGCREDGGGTLDLVGIYGFAGLGKTTLCEGLCDFFFAEFNGKVCHVDLARSPSNSLQASILYPEHGRMLHVLSTLTGYSNEYRYSQVIQQVKNLLTERISLMTDPVFLAIDNILPAEESQEEADFYLSCEFPKGSKIFITSRSESILTNLTSQRSCTFSAVIEYMPKLRFQEARDILVHEFPDLCKKGFSNLGDELLSDLNAWVHMCTIHRERYHPVMLKSLAAYVRWNRRHKRDWKERLRGLRSEGTFDKNDTWGRVFQLLDNTYNLLSEEAQNVFLELALLSSATRFHFSHQFCESVWRFYPDTRIFFDLQDLGFIEGNSHPNMSDLLVDFSKYKVGQEGAMPRYVVVEEDQWNITHAQYVLPKSVRNVSISRCRKALGSTLDMTHMEELRVLHLVDNAGLQQVLLSSTACAHLRSLIVTVPEGSSLCCVLMDADWSSTQFQANNMKLLLLHGNVSFQCRRDLEMTAISPLEMDLGHKLGGLSLIDVPSLPSIDVTSCVNLKELHLKYLPGLRSVRCLANSGLAVFNIEHCEELRELTFSADNHNLSSAYAHDPNLDLCLHKLPWLSCISGLDKSTSLYAMDVSHCERLPMLAIRFDCTHVSIRNYSPAIGDVMGGQDILSYLIEAQDSSSDCFNPWLGKPQPLLGELLDNIDGVDPSICKARVCKFRGGRLKTLGLHAEVEEMSFGLHAEVKEMSLEDAQHVGLLVTALFNARPRALEYLSITCSTHGSGCGCDQNPPHFGPLVFEQKQRSFSAVHGPVFDYHCPQVRDLESLAQWHLLRFLYLSGCTSVEAWPDFGAMTCLVGLDLSNTSLKEWPAGVQLLPDLRWLDINSCVHLSTQQLMRVLTFQLQSRKTYLTCIQSFCRSLRLDLEAGIRDKRSVVDAIDALSAELAALFDRSSASLSEAESFRTRVVHQTLVYSLYEMWPFEDVRQGRDEEVRMYTRTKLRRLLCSTGFLSLSFLPPTVGFDVEGGLKGIALVGASFHYYNIAPVNDSIGHGLKWWINLLSTSMYDTGLFQDYVTREKREWERQLLKRRAVEAVHTMGGVMHIADKLPEKVHMALEANLGGTQLDFTDSEYEAVWFFTARIRELQARRVHMISYPRFTEGSAS